VKFIAKNIISSILKNNEQEWSWRETTSEKEYAGKNERERIGGNKKSK
jgi:hypothetical protein